MPTEVNKPNFTKTFSLVLLPFVPFHLAATELPTDSFDSLLSNKDFVGEVLITQGGKPVYQFESKPHSYLAGYENGGYLAGSISKQFVAAGILRLVDEDKVSLDSQIIKILPDAGIPGTVLIRHLLDHSSGLIAPNKPLAFLPGTGFRYSNYGYDLLGKVLESAHKQPLSEVLDGISKQCGLSQTGGELALVQGRLEDTEGNITLLPATAERPPLASGGLVSRAQDLARWNTCLYGSELLSEESLSYMTSATQSRNHRWGTLGYGAGIQISRVIPLEYSHSGYVPGFSSTLSYFPDKDISMVVLESTSWHWRDIPRAFRFHDELRKQLLVQIQE